MDEWKQVGKRILLDHSKFLRIEEHIVVLPDGTRIENWPMVITPDYVSILACTRDRRFVCFRQVKYAVGGDILSAPGGYLEPGEDPLSGARRELLEETGYVSEKWTDLGRFVVDSNRGCGKAHLYLAHDAERQQHPCSDDLEEQQLLLLTREELEASLDSHECKVLAWEALLLAGLRCLDRLSRKQPPGDAP